MGQLREALRWLSVIPGALLAAVLVSFPIHWVAMAAKFMPDSGESILTTDTGQSVFSAMHTDDLERLGYALIVPATMILVGARIAPRRRFAVAILLAILLTVTLGISLHFISSMSNARLSFGAIPFWIMVALWSISVFAALFMARAQQFEASKGGS